MMKLVASLTPLAALVTACVLEPDVGPPLAGTCKDTDSDPETAVSFSGSIRPLLDRSMGGCGCHMPSAGGGSTGIQLSGLDLSSTASLRRGGAMSSARIVVAGQPCESVIFQKVSDAPPFGSRMPLGGPPFFTPDELQLLRDWIAEGAADN
jgi:hypothetical protein